MPRRRPTLPGRENVWDYPRPPRVEPTSRRLRVEHAGVVLAETRRAVRVLETSHPPVYYIPPEDVRLDLLETASGRSWCEWKGGASYYDLVLEGQRIPKVAWAYHRPTPLAEPLRDHLAFYAHKLDLCTVDGERIQPQPGDFYGGWITSDLDGPFKGGPGSAGW